MKEQYIMRKFLIIAGLLIAVVLAGVHYRKDIASLIHRRTATHQVNGRKVLYWYDAMNPQHHYSGPGKAPDGMDLVPKYAEEVAAPASSQERKILYWYDPMHPKYKSDKPGIAPDCGMELVPKYAEEAEAKPASKERKVLYWYAPMDPSYHSDHPGKSPMGMDLLPKYADESEEKLAPGTVKISPERQQLIGVRTAKVKRSRLTRTIRTTGTVVPDETKIAHIHVKVNGWIDQVYVDFVGQLIKKGQPVFTVYSPDLVATQQDYLIALKGKKYLTEAPYREVSEGADSLLAATRQRLRLWDVSDQQIQELEKTGKVEKTMTFYSPVTGFVLDRQAYPQSAVDPDKELYRVADLSTIWVDAAVYESDLPYIQKGQKATVELSYYPGKSYTGRVAYVYPTVDPQTRTLNVRLEFPNPNYDLKPQMFADVSLDVDYGTHVVVPAEAVLDSGIRKTVFVAKGDGYFEPRNVTVGPRVHDQYIVLSGLKVGETIVTSGNFLIDSESQLNAATSDMAGPKN
jgi:RND family efflux transporter MFP subunit